MHHSGIRRMGWLACAVMGLNGVAVAANPVRVLILTGKNVHDWQATTPELKNLFDTSGRFRPVDVLNDPARLDTALLTRYDAVVSNWTAHPQMTGHPWGSAAEQALIGFVRSGKGFVAFHAASTADHDWPEFQQLVGLTWKWEHTSHTPYTTFKVTIDDQNHPITRGMTDFYTVDELYQKMVSLGKAEYHTVCKAFAGADINGSTQWEPMMITTRLGDGRGVNLLLGHDVAAMRNPAFRTLMLRGTEWAATGEVTIPIPPEWPHNAASAIVVGVDPDQAVRAILAWKFGQSRQPLFMVEQLVNHATSLSGPKGTQRRRALADRLAQSLSAEAAPELKAFLCTQLSIIGDTQHVKAIAPLLADEQASSAAGQALVRIGGNESSLALRSALDRLSGNLRIGVVNCLGQLRDREAMPVLTGLLKNGDSDDLVSAAAAALAQIGEPEATQAIAEAYARAEGNRRVRIADAYLRCAERLAGEQRKTAAAKIYRQLYGASEPMQVRMAALRGFIACDPRTTDELLIDALVADDARLRSAAVSILHQVKQEDEAGIADWLIRAIRRQTKPEMKARLLHQLGCQSTPAALQQVTTLLEDSALTTDAASAVLEISAHLAATHGNLVASALREVLKVAHSTEVLEKAHALLIIAEKPVNLALGATASSPDGIEPDGASGPDAAAIDGDPDTYWDETDNQQLYRFRVTFPHPTRVSAIKIKGHAYHSHSPKDFDILCDDQPVKTVVNGDYDPATNEMLVRFNAVTCGSVELKITGWYGGSPGIRELEIYDLAPLPPGDSDRFTKSPSYSWKQTDTFLALMNHDRIVWRFNHGKDEPKPCFYPVALTDGTPLTAMSPPDHHWHRSLWFAWKDLNGLDYWTEDLQTGLSPGRTEITQVKTTPGSDFSATIEVNLSYRPPEKPAVLAERRVLRVSTPDADGSYRIDWTCEFTPGNQDVEIKGGTAGGGYAGLSVRIAQNSQDWQLTDSEGRRDTPSAFTATHTHGQQARWADFSLVSNVNLRAAGITVFDHPRNPRHPTYWHNVIENKTPFGYFSPALVWKEPFILQAGKSLTLQYRVLIHPERWERERVEKAWQDYVNSDRLHDER